MKWKHSASEFRAQGTVASYSGRVAEDGTVVLAVKPSAQVQALQSVDSAKRYADMIESAWPHLWFALLNAHDPKQEKKEGEKND